MCHEKILGFKKCGHSATTLMICERNGEIAFQECPRGWSGKLDLEDGLCLGCQSTLALPSLCHDQALWFIKTRPKKMPFSYVAYGLVPRSAAHCADLTEREPMLILYIYPYDDIWPPREWLSLPPPPPWEREKPTCAQTEKRLQANKLDRNVTKPPQGYEKAKTTSTQSDHKPLSSLPKTTQTSIACQQLQVQCNNQDQLNPPSALKNKHGSALERSTNRATHKKNVSFFQHSHVQYFFKDVRTSSVSSHSTGEHEYCAVEPVIWGPKPHPYWYGPVKEGNEEITSGGPVALFGERGLSLAERLSL